MPESKDLQNQEVTMAEAAVLIILISLVIGLNVYRWNAGRLMGNSFPMPLGFGMAIVLSGSMEPYLNVNDLVVVVPAESYEEGEVIVFQENGSLIIHRVIAIDAAAEKLQTKGDANNAPDEPVSFTQVKGREAFHIPFVGIIVRGLKSPVGVIAVLVLAVFLMHSSWKKEKESGTEELDAIKAEIRKLKEEQESVLLSEAKNPAEKIPRSARNDTKDAKTLPIPEDDRIDIPLQHK